MGCGCSSTIAIIEITSAFDISKYFRGSIRKGFSLDGFSEYSVFSHEREGQVFSPKLNIRISLKILLKKFIENSFIIYVKKNSQHQDYLDKITMGEGAHICNELERSLSAHIVGSEQIYTPYNPSIRFANSSASLDPKSLSDWAESVLDNGKGRLDPESKEPVVFQALELRMINAVMTGANTYEFGKHIVNILGNKVAPVIQDAV